MKPRWTRSLIVLPLAAAFVAACITPDQARPWRGSIPWSFILCKFSDSTTPPNDVQYYQNMTIASGTHSLADYVKSISYGQVDLNGSTLHGWYTEPHTTAYEVALGQGNGGANRIKRLNDCLATAAASTTDKYVPPSGQRVYVITWPQVDVVGFENVAALGGGPQSLFGLPEVAHEFGHGIGLEHSWSNDTTWCDGGPNPCTGGGVYDNPWDLMSAANIYADPTGAFGGGPPGLDAYHLDDMGWMPQSRVVTLGSNGILSQTVTLAALTHPEVSGALLVRVPFDANDRYQYYTIEYRTPDGWDSGIPQSVVMINQIQKNASYTQTTLLRELGSYAGTGNGPPVQSLTANGVTISVVGTSGDHATVAISTQLALPCASGFVFRATSSIDRVCVTQDEKNLALSQDSASRTHQQPNSTTCVDGYVWRAAYPNDNVCVTPAQRSAAATEDANSYNNANQNLAVYGPNTCQSGYVWRSADDDDYVCVSYATEAQVQADDAAASGRHLPGSDTCKAGYVWRSAWPSDHACVPPASRAQATSDNAQAQSRLLQPQANANIPKAMA
jgi:hypothetical protein